MKAVALTALHTLEIQERPEPRIDKDTDVLLRIDRVGVCGSDVHYFETGRIGSAIIDYPFILGHECTATVVQVGHGVTRVRVGDRVTIDPAVACCRCDQCRIGRPNTCRNLVFLGCPGQISGCLCETLVMPEACCFVLPEAIGQAQGVLCEPLAIGIYAVQQASVVEGTRVAVLGSGPIGLSCLAASRAEHAARCYVTDLIPERLAYADRQGASWTGNPQQENIVDTILNQEPNGVDVVFECAGQQQTLDQAIAMLKPGGWLMIIGIPRGDRVVFDPHEIRRKEITIVNVRRQNNRTQTAVDWVAQGRVHIEDMITHTFAAARVQQAFAMVSAYQDGVIKALIEF
jgi:L-iditol 2-dehydrogenase